MRGVLNKFCIGAPVNAGDAVADPTAIYLANTLHYFPTPNVSNPGLAINYIANGKSNSFTNQETFRVDDNFSQRQKIFARYTRFDRTQDPTQFFNNPGGPQSFTGVGATASQYVLGDTITASPTSVIDLRLSYLRYFSYLQPANTNVNVAAFDGTSQAGFWNAAAREIPPYFQDIIISNNVTLPYHYAGVFLNDTFSLSPQFTITAGVRYELPGSFYEKSDNNAVIIPGQANPLVLVNSAGYGEVPVVLALRAENAAGRRLESCEPGTVWGPGFDGRYRAVWSSSPDSQHTPRLSVLVARGLLIQGVNCAAKRTMRLAPTHA